MSGYDRNGTEPDSIQGGACTNSTDGYELQPGYNGSYWFQQCNAKHDWDHHVKEGDNITAKADANWARLTEDEPFCYNTQVIVSCYCSSGNNQ
jgi:hypothetical protein